MKRTLAIIFSLLLLLIAGGCKQQKVGTVVSTGNYERNSIPYNIQTLLSTTVTGSGEANYLGVPYDKYTCSVIWSGVTPSNTVVAVLGSIDGTTFASFATVTVEESGTMFHIVNKPAFYLKGDYVSKSSGSTNTSVTLKCLEGGN